MNTNIVNSLPGYTSIRQSTSTSAGQGSMFDRPSIFKYYVRTRTVALSVWKACIHLSGSWQLPRSWRSRHEENKIKSGDWFYLTTTRCRCRAEKVNNSVKVRWTSYSNKRPGNASVVLMRQLYSPHVWILNGWSVFLFYGRKFSTHRS